MFTYLLRRLISIIVVLLAVNAATYMIINFLSLRGPMAYGYVPDTIVPFIEIVKPYPAYLFTLLGGNPGDIEIRIGGNVFFEESGVIQVIQAALPRSLILLSISVTFAIVVGIMVGLFSVNYRKREVSPAALVASLGGFSLPGFYVGILTLYIMYNLAVKQGIGPDAFFLPVSGYGLDNHLILPVIALAARPTAEIARLTAEMLVEELPKDYIRTARAKGLPWRLVVLRHAARNVAGGVVTALGNSLSHLLGALVIIETVFAWGGLGESFLDSVLFSQFGGSFFSPELVAALATAMAVMFLLIDLVTELAAQILDPRLRRAHGGSIS